MLPRLIPAQIMFLCNGMVYHWREGSTKAFPCGVVQSGDLTVGPAGWELHPTYGWLCPSCAAAKGEPRMLAGK